MYKTPFGKSGHIYILYQGLNLVDVLENALFGHAFGYMVELTVTGWCNIATYRCNYF